MKTYEGMLQGGGFPAKVIVTIPAGDHSPKGPRLLAPMRYPLKLRLDLSNHSPTGFAFGYGGSGPAQLALALLADATGDGDLAINLHQQFKWAKIAPLAQNENWTMTDTEIKAWVDAETKDRRP